MPNPKGGFVKPESAIVEWFATKKILRETTNIVIKDDNTLKGWEIAKHSLDKLSVMTPISFAEWYHKHTVNELEDGEETLIGILLICLACKFVRIV